MADIPFSQIPSTLRVPLFYAEVDNSQANSATQVQRTLIIGPKTGLGTGIVDRATPCIGGNDAAILAGPNSQLAQMVDAYRANDAFGELWVGLLHDDASAVAATATITFTAAATAPGVYTVYIGAIKYQVPVTTAMNVTAIALALKNMIVADKRQTVSANASAGVITLTADCKGIAGNDYPIYEYYGGASAGEVAPVGLATTIVAFASGAINPSLTNLLAACGDKAFDFIVCPYNDSTSQASIASFLNDQTGRWSWGQQVYGHAFFGTVGTLSTLVTFGDGLNNQHFTYLGWNNAASSAWVLAAALAGTVAVSTRADPGRPMQTLVCNGLLPPQQPDRFTLVMRDQLLHNGISTFTVLAGQVILENIITTYQLNAYAAPDNSYLEIETMFLLMFILRDLRTLVTSKFGRVKLAADSTQTAVAGVVTPSIIKGALIARYAELEQQGIVQGTDEFAQQIIVQQNSQNPNRVDVLYPAILIDQLRIFATLLQFRLQV